MDPIFAILLGVALTLATLWLIKARWSFAAQRPEDYAAATPAFDIRAELNGPILCEGIIYGPAGRVASRFVADMRAEWQGNTGRMTENFVYDSGSTQAREWTFTVSDDGAIRAEAPDLVGMGRGRQQGNAVSLSYRIRLTPEAGGHELDVTDWMYLAPNGTIVNRSQFRKFGIKVAELVATMRRVPA